MHPRLSPHSYFQSLRSVSYTHLDVYKRQDLDTVMPGAAMNDFGDAVRIGASTA